MNITEICKNEREAVLPKWVDGFFASYDLNSVGLLRTGSDPFTNPVGQTTRESLAVLYDAVAGNDTTPELVREALARLVRIRAIQEMPPSKAVGALYSLKTLLRAHVLPKLMAQGAGKAGGENNSKDSTLMSAYLETESRVDSLALMAFDMYMADREKVCNARVEEIKRSQSQVLRLVKQRDPAVGADIPGK